MKKHWWTHTHTLRVLSLRKGVCITTFSVQQHPPTMKKNLSLAESFSNPGFSADFDPDLWDSVDWRIKCEAPAALLLSRDAISYTVSHTRDSWLENNILVLQNLAAFCGTQWIRESITLFNCQKAVQWYSEHTRRGRPSSDLELPERGIRWDDMVWKIL